MSKNVTPAQARRIADSLAAVGKYLAEFVAKNHSKLDDEQLTTILGRQNQLFLGAMTAREQAIRLELDDAQADLATILAATRSAKDAIRTITKVKSVVEIAGGVVALATAVSTADLKDTVKAAKDLTKSVNRLLEADG